MPKTITYDSLHYCVFCEDCGTQSNYGGEMPDASNVECQHVNTTTDYDCSCNLWTRILIHDLFDEWASDRRYRRKHKYHFQIVNYGTGEIFKKIDRYAIQKGVYDLVDLIARTDNSEFTQRWSLSGPSLTVHHKSTIRDEIYVIRSGRN